MKEIKWLAAPQHTEWGNLETGEVVNLSARGIPAEVAAVWVRDGHAEEVKQKKTAPKKDAE